MRPIYRYIFCMTLLFLLISTRTASATTALYVTDSQQATISTAVVIATIGDAKTSIHTEYNSIRTVTTIQIEEVLYGKAPVRLKIEQMGGTLNGRTLKIPGDATLKKGERCVLFLFQNTKGWFLTALQQSKYNLQAHPKLGWVMERNLPEGVVIRKPDGQLQSYKEAPNKPLKSLQDFRQKMQQLDAVRSTK